MNDHQLAEMNGGTILHLGGEVVYDFGFVATENPEIYTNETDDDIDLTPNKHGKLLLTDFSKAANGGKHFPRVWQLTGSCVRQGGYHALTNRAGVEVCLLPQAERFAPVDTWLAYAASRARFNGGDREGEGSTGDGMALELGRVGAIPLDHPLAAKYADCGDVIVYDRAVEFNQSSIRNYTQEYLQVAKKFTVQRQTVRSASEAVAELNKGRPLTWAGTWGGLMNCPVEEGLLLNRHAGTWNHQQECPGYWDHPKLGLLFFIQNNWFMPTNDCKVEYSGRNISRVVKPGKCVSVHGTTANYNEPPGGYWIREKDMDFQCRSGEVRSLSGFNGFDGKVGTDAI